MSILQIAWFVLIGVLLAGYVILDGYDLGVGFWHLLSRSESERKVLRRAIAPYWDANEVWLITAGGALFAAFPMVYATVFSGFYLALMLVVFALIFRAVSIEFVEHAPSPGTKRFWEVAFGLGSALPALLFGVAMGNVLRGLPMDASGNYTGTFLDLLNPYSLLIGLTGFALFASHGQLFPLMRANTPPEECAIKRSQRSFGAYYLLLMVSVAATIATQPHLMTSFAAMPVLLAFPFFALMGGPVIAIFIGQLKFGRAFTASCVSIVLLFATLAAALFPNFVPALGGKGKALTIANSSSSPLTLGIMLGVAVIGMVVVLVYTIWVRRAFRGGSVEY